MDIVYQQMSSAICLTKMFRRGLLFAWSENGSRSVVICVRFEE
jgi:hypothetical protein